MRAADAHPNVVTVRDYAVQDEYLCVVMDLASGGDLFDLVSDKASQHTGIEPTAGLSEAEAKFYTAQLAQEIVQAAEAEFDGVQAQVEQQIVMISHTDPQRGFAQVQMVFESRQNEMSQITYQKNSGDQLAFHFLVNQINNLVDSIGSSN